MALMFSFFEGVVRKGPGSEASTLKALSMLDGLPPSLALSISDAVQGWHRWSWPGPPRATSRR